jgi:hypothetical protein
MLKVRCDRDLRVGFNHEKIRFILSDLPTGGLYRRVFYDEYLRFHASIRSLRRTLSISRVIDIASDDIYQLCGNVPLKVYFLA